MHESIYKATQQLCKELEHIGEVLECIHECILADAAERQQDRDETKKAAPSN